MFKLYTFYKKYFGSMEQLPTLKLLM